MLPNLLMMLNDSSFAVLKKVIKTTSIIYQRLISWLAKSDNLAPDDKLTNIWNTLVSLKTNIINMVDSDIEGYAIFNFYKRRIISIYLEASLFFHLFSFIVLCMFTVKVFIFRKLFLKYSWTIMIVMFCWLPLSCCQI